MGGQMFLVSHECMETYGETEINMKLQYTVWAASALKITQMAFSYLGPPYALKN